MNKRSPTEFVFCRILRASGIEPGSPDSVLLADLDHLNLADVTTAAFIAAVAEVLHDEQEHKYMDRGWMLKQCALTMAMQMLLRVREPHLARGHGLPVESLEEFGQLPAGSLQRARREPSEVN